MAKCPITLLARKASAAGCPFLVIGGYAVYAHGYVRTTEDLDLITSRGQRDAWKKLLGEMELTIINDASNFLQSQSRDESDMDVDLMFVSEDVFARLDAAAIEAEVEGERVRVVSLVHLIALKCHALQHSNSLRRLKDMDDLFQLILINRLNLNEPELRATILKHGDQDLYDKLQRACAE